jgi:penicillin-binding protein 2
LQPLPPARGYIYDRNGVLLADNYPVFTATLSKTDVERRSEKFVDKRIG